MPLGQALTGLAHLRFLPWRCRYRRLLPDSFKKQKEPSHREDGSAEKQHGNRLANYVVGGFGAGAGVGGVVDVVGSELSS
jgi:hypothetical protein